MWITIKFFQNYKVKTIFNTIDAPEDSSIYSNDFATSKKSSNSKQWTTSK